MCLPPQVFLQRTSELVDLMLPAMDGMPTGAHLCHLQHAPVAARDTAAISAMNIWLKPAWCMTQASRQTQ